MSRRRTSLSSSPESDAHFVQLAEWLAMEAEAEAAQIAARIQMRHSPEAEKTGESLLDLVVSDSDRGIGGHQLVTLVKRNRQKRMPWHRLRAGSPILISSFPDAADSRSGVVSARTQDSIQVAIEQLPDAERFRIDLTCDEITRQRQLAAITIAHDSRGRLGELRRVLVGEAEPSFGPLPELKFRLQLNTSQQDAVEFAMSAADVAIIHGPPGTGKTTTVVELILQSVALGQKVLATAPSNTAVDNLLEKLIEQGCRSVRLGHPARIHSDLQGYSLDGLVAAHDHAPIVRELQREADSLRDKAERFTRIAPPRGARQEWRREAARLRADARRLEKQAADDILDRAQVICATNTFNEEWLGDRWFDLAVIDEACQGTEPGCWVPLIRADRVVLAGDHCQLPPTVLSQQAAQQGFSTSLLERIHQLHGEKATRMLTTQYRMNREIMDFSSQYFYDGQLIADDSVIQNRLVDLESVSADPLTQTPVRYIDTAGANWDEQLEPDGDSRLNPKESKLVINLIKQLVDLGVASEQIAVIAPYAAQIRLVRSECPYEKIEIDTVDGFQGREKEVVILTFVRSNPIGEIGFLSDTRRTNVALTRARSQLVVIGDSATLGRHDFYRSLLEYFELIGAYESVWNLGIEV